MEGVTSYEWLNTTTCSDLFDKYASQTLIDNMNNDHTRGSLKEFLKEEFLESSDFGDGWLCPDIASFSIYGDPTNFVNG